MLIQFQEPHAGLGCACDQQLGALDFGSAGIGAGTIAAIAALAIGIYALSGNPARERRAKLAEARQRYSDEVAKIRKKYGRFGRKGD